MTSNEDARCAGVFVGGHDCESVISERPRRSGVISGQKKLQAKTEISSTVFGKSEATPEPPDLRKYLDCSVRFVKGSTIYKNCLIGCTEHREW